MYIKHFTEPSNNHRKWSLITWDVVTLLKLLQESNNLDLVNYSIEYWSFQTLESILNDGDAVALFSPWQTKSAWKLNPARSSKRQQTSDPNNIFRNRRQDADYRPDFDHTFINTTNKQTVQRFAISEMKSCLTTEHDFSVLVHTILHTHILQTSSCTIE